MVESFNHMENKNLCSLRLVGFQEVIFYHTKDGYGIIQRIVYVFKSFEDVTNSEVL